MTPQLHRNPVPSLHKPLVLKWFFRYLFIMTSTILTSIANKSRAYRPTLANGNLCLRMCTTFVEQLNGENFVNIWNIRWHHIDKVSLYIFVRDVLIHWPDFYRAKFETWRHWISTTNWSLIHQGEMFRQTKCQILGSLDWISWKVTGNEPKRPRTKMYRPIFSKFMSSDVLDVGKFCPRRVSISNGWCLLQCLREVNSDSKFPPLT